MAEINERASVSIDSQPLSPISTAGSTTTPAANAGGVPEEIRRLAECAAEKVGAFVRGQIQGLSYYVEKCTDCINKY